MTDSLSTGFGRRAGLRLRHFFRTRRQAAHARRGQRAMRRVCRQLQLSDSQRDGLAALVQEFQALVSQARGRRRDGIDAVAGAVMANPMDTALVQSSVADNFDALQRQLNAALARFGDWFATLDDAQRQQFRLIVRRRLGVA